MPEAILHLLPRIHLHIEAAQYAPSDQSTTVHRCRVVLRAQVLVLDLAGMVW